MFQLGWTWARFGQAIFSNVSVGLDLDLQSPVLGQAILPMCLFTWTWAVAVAVLRTCVEDEALGGLMSPSDHRLRRLGPLTTNVSVGMVEVGAFAF